MYVQVMSGGLELSFFVILGAVDEAVNTSLEPMKIIRDLDCVTNCRELNKLN